MNTENYSIGFGSTEDYKGTFIVLSVLLGVVPFDNNKTDMPWYKRF